jgi:hypothetical protein
MESICASRHRFRNFSYGILRFTDWQEWYRKRSGRGKVSAGGDG